MTVLLIGPPTAATDEVRRLSAAAGVALTVTTDVAEAMTAWPTARAVLIDQSWLGTLARLNPERREHVVIVTTTTMSDEDWRDAVVLGARDVCVLPADGRTVTAVLREAGSDPAAPMVALVSGCGGAGATVLAAAMARMAAESVDTLLMETDPLSASALSVLGYSTLPGVGWEDVAESGVPSAASLHHSVPRHGRLGVLTWPEPRQPGPGAPFPELPVDLVTGTVRSARASHSAVVVDVDRHHTGLLRALAVAAVQLVVVVHGQPRCLATAARVVRLAGPVHTRLVVRTRRGDRWRPSDLTTATGVPNVHLMPDERRLDEQVRLEVGTFTRRGPLQVASAELWSAVLA